MQLRAFLPGPTELPSWPTFPLWRRSWRPSGYLSVQNHLLATLQIDLSVQNNLAATSQADLSIQDYLLATLQADLCIQNHILTIFQADLYVQTTFQRPYMTTLCDHDHILFEIVFKIIDFTYSLDEHTSCTADSATISLRVHSSI